MLGLAAINWLRLGRLNSAYSLAASASVPTVISLRVTVPLMTAGTVLGATVGVGVASPQAWKRGVRARALAPNPRFLANRRRLSLFSTFSPCWPCVGWFMVKYPPLAGLRWSSFSRPVYKSILVTSKRPLPAYWGI